MDQVRLGILALSSACVMWGLMPLYFKMLSHVPPLEILAQRTIWSVVFFAIVLAVQGRLGTLITLLRTPRTAGTALFAALMISTNWFAFIWSVQVGRTTETSLGYYIFPLVVVFLGVIVYRERLSRVQWLAVALATGAVTVLTIGLGTAPWVSLVIAFSFGIYGLIKKGVEAGPVVSVAAEVVLLSPLALAWLIWLWIEGQGHFTDLRTAGLLMLSGVLTGFPLMLFSSGARRVRLATTGLIQYINPTLQFFCAVVIFSEPFGAVHAVAFAMIWTALALYSASSVYEDRALRARRRAGVS